MYFKNILHPYIRSTKQIHEDTHTICNRPLIIFDKNSAHTSKSFRNLCYNNKISKIEIPTGLTPLLQVIDINECVSGYIKSKVECKYINHYSNTSIGWLCNKELQNSQHSQIKELTTKWIIQAISDLPKDINLRSLWENIVL